MNLCVVRFIAGSLENKIKVTNKIWIINIKISRMGDDNDNYRWYIEIWWQTLWILMIKFLQTYRLLLRKSHKNLHFKVVEQIISILKFQKNLHFKWCSRLSRSWSKHTRTCFSKWNRSSLLSSRAHKNLILKVNQQLENVCVWQSQLLKLTWFLWFCEFRVFIKEVWIW